MGSDDVKLQYIDDEADSYSNIFDNAKTDITDTDKARLIASLKTLSEGENIESVVDIEQVMRYFVVHNFVNNEDSYTGTMIHNYYLYEKDGVMQMLPWDYNLAYGTFQSSDSTSEVNVPIDTPVSGTVGEDRPMIHWIFTDTEYTDLYHQYFAEFLEQVDFSGRIQETAGLIAEYVEKDPTKFCTYEEFETGVAIILEYCRLRKESVAGQLEGSIASTTEGQEADASTLIDASHITISDMGTMQNMGGGPGGTASASDARPSPPDRGSASETAFPGEAPQTGASDAAGQSTGSQSSMILLGASAAFLLLGLVFAYRFKERI